MVVLKTKAGIASKSSINQFQAWPLKIAKDACMGSQVFVLVVPVSCDVQSDATCSNGESSRGCRQSSTGDGETLEDNAAMRKQQNTQLPLTTILTLTDNTCWAGQCAYDASLLHCTLITVDLSHFLVKKTGTVCVVCEVPFRESHD